MNARLTRKVIEVVKAERNRRSDERSKLDHQEAEYDRWLYVDVPFIGEICLPLLVAIRHQLEKSFLCLAARVTKDGRELTPEEYARRVQKERDSSREKNGWRDLRKKLHLEDNPELKGSMETLRLLANSYKHNPFGEPDKCLLMHLKKKLEPLKFDSDLSYSSVSESPEVMAAVAKSLELSQDADYCDIVEELQGRVECLLSQVQEEMVGMSNVKRGPVSFADPKDFAY